MIRPPVRRLVLAASLALLLAPAPLAAQTLAGQVVRPGTREPVPAHWVRLVRHRGEPHGTTIDSARTDARGLFQLVAPEPGAYQLALGGGEWRVLLSPVDTLAADASVERMYELAPKPPEGSDEVYFEFQVDVPVVVQPGVAGAPRYPPEMRANNIEGEVLVQFVVDTLGQVEPGSIRMLKYTHRQFALAVAEALPRGRYLPARKGGRPVRQLVQQPFEFALQR